MSELTEILWDWELHLKTWKLNRGERLAQTALMSLLWQADIDPSVGFVMTAYPTDPAMFEIVCVLDPQLKKLVEIDK